MTAWYNEIDPKKAAWLRELIRAGLIADGEVDERPIEVVQPTDLRGYTQLHFFAGIGGWSRALRLAGWADDVRVWTGSCPCQSFSASGKGRGFSDPRHLWPAWFRLIRECCPNVVLGEQVANRAGLAWFDVVSADVEGAGYTVGAADLCAAGVGAPHIRQRLFFVADDSTARRGEVSGGIAGTDRRTTAQSRRLRDVGDMADTADGGRSARNPGSMDQEEFEKEIREPQPRVASQAAEHRGPTGLVGDTESGGRGIVRDAALAGSGGHPDGAEQSRGVGNADSPGRSERDRARRIPRIASGQATGEGADDSGHDESWRDIEWLECSDGKARPTQSGLFPLAHGVSARVGRLRGYGDAIVPQVAASFIRAYLDVRTA